MFEHIWTEEERAARNKAELRKVKAALGPLEPQKLKAAEGLMQAAAFQRVMLMELQALISRDGYIEEYQNGENQRGYKKAAAVDVYDRTLNTYSKVVKQLMDFLPNDAGTPGAELMAFIGK